jgi:lipopolysaccharide export system protein LptA
MKTRLLVLMIPVLALLLIAPPLDPSRAQDLGESLTSDQPINITARKMEVRSDKNIILFVGDVVVVQGDVTITADKLKIITSENGGNSAEEIIASGHVQFRQYFPETGKERFATGENAHYYRKVDKVVLTGKPRAWEDDNLVTGEEMTFYINENIFEVDGKEKKVKAIFYPGGENQGEGGTGPEDGSSESGEPAGNPAEKEIPETQESPPESGGTEALPGD